jgi:hypothetical protein
MQIPEAVAVEYLRRWGQEIAHGGQSGGLGYPTRSTLHTAMVFHGPGSRSNVTPPAPEIDPAVWLTESIVCEIGKESPRKAAVLRAAFCWYGTWADRLARAVALVERSGGDRIRLSRRTYFRLKDEAIGDVAWFLSLCAS